MSAVSRRVPAISEQIGSPNDQVAATRQAIEDVTAFDERDINRNFDDDDEAYGEVKRNLGRLILSGR